MVINVAEKNNEKLTKGGHFDSKPNGIRCSNRLKYPKDKNCENDEHSIKFGFRLAFYNEQDGKNLFPKIFWNKINKKDK